MEGKPTAVPCFIFIYLGGWTLTFLIMCTPGFESQCQQWWMERQNDKLTMLCTDSVHQTLTQASIGTRLCTPFTCVNNCKPLMWYRLMTPVWSDTFKMHSPDSIFSGESGSHLLTIVSLWLARGCKSDRQRERHELDEKRIIIPIWQWHTETQA